MLNHIENLPPIDRAQYYDMMAKDFESESKKYKELRDQNIRLALEIGETTTSDMTVRAIPVYRRTVSRELAELEIGTQAYDKMLELAVEEYKDKWTPSVVMLEAHFSKSGLSKEDAKKKAIELCDPNETTTSYKFIKEAKK